MTLLLRILVITVSSAMVAHAQQSRPADTQAALESAATLLADSRPGEALAQLQFVEQEEPDNPWLWYYTGTARFQLGEPYRAIDAYDRALSILSELGEPDPSLAEKIREHRVRARRQVFRLSLRAGLAYDTNVTYAGADAAALGFISGRSDGRFESQFQVDYAPVVTATDTIALGVRLPQAWHFAVQEFDYQDYGAYLRYTRKLDERWSAAVQYDYDLAYLGMDPFVSSHVLTPSLSYHWAPSAESIRLDRTTIYYRFAADDFRFDTRPEFDRDGLSHGVGIEQSAQLRPITRSAWTWDLFAGYRFDSVFTDGTEFDRREHNFYAGFTMPLVNPSKPERYLLIPDKPLNFSFSSQWQIGEYRHRSLIDAGRDSRSDLITTLNFGLSQTLLRDAQLGDLILHGLIRWTDAESDVTTARSRTFPFRRSSPFTYDKVVYGVQLEWAW